MVNMKKNEAIILSLGGSLIYPKPVLDINFLRNFDKFIRNHVQKGRKFFIVCGGGYISRKYQLAIKEVIGTIKHEDMDWLGIHATRINAHLVRTILKDLADPQVIDNYHKKYNLNDYPVVICSGWKPGWSTDYCAARLALQYKVKLMINMSNVKMVYDKDPHQFKDAKPIKTWSWKEYRKLSGDKWIPGMNLPFDPIASKLASEINLKVIILDGKNLLNLENCLEGKKFVGTTIS